MRAAAQSGNFPLVVDGAELLAGLLEGLWDHVHPQLEEYDFIGRKTPCESLTKLADFLNPLTRVILLEHPRLGRYSGVDLVRFAREGASAPNYGMFRALLEATEPADLQAIVDRFDQLRMAIRRADSVLTEHAEGDTSTNFEPTYEQIEALRSAVAALIPGGAAADEGAGESAESGGESGSAMVSAGGQTAGGPSFSGGINSRDDVIRAIDAICAYYARSEPSSPVPHVLRRARDWITLDFLAVLEDIAPGSLDEAKRVLTSGRKIESSGEAFGSYASESPASSSNDGW